MLLVFLVFLLTSLGVLFWLHQSQRLSECLHDLAVLAMRFCPSRLLQCVSRCPVDSVECMGLSFRNPIGLAAGWDKQAQCLDALQALGFGFVEVGGVTPLPQSGNPRPRVFRLSQHRAIINRYGLNSHGVNRVVKRLKAFHSTGMRVGANIAPNSSTPSTQWIDDYATCLGVLYPYVDYFTINLSCPNTGHRKTQNNKTVLESLLIALAKTRDELHLLHDKKRPVLIKTSPDMDHSLWLSIVTLCRDLGFDGIVSGNTSTDRQAVASSPWATEAGGLSGRPLYPKNLKRIRSIESKVNDGFIAIAVGGIENAQQVQALRAAGAQLIQVYSAFVYNGPSIISKLCQR